MWDEDDARENTDAENRERDLDDELRAEQQDLDDRLGIAHLGPRERAEARGFAGGFGRMVAAGPPGGTSGHEAEHPGPEQPPAGTSGWEQEQDRPDRPAETRERQGKGEQP